MKKNQSYSSFYFFMKELRQLYGQLIIGTSTSEKLYVTPDSQGKPVPFSESTLVDKVQCDPLVVAHAKSIMHWSLVVYGKKDILQKEMKDILKNPALGSELSWKIATDPLSVHKFAGINACGLKNKTRQNAEQAIMSLCGSIGDYTQAVKYKRDYLSSQTQQKSCEQPERHAATPQSLHKPLDHSERDKGPLTNERIVEMFHGLSSIRIYEEQIKFWCTKVYGDSNVLTKKIMGIRKNPASGDDLLNQVTEDPASIHRLSGINICGLKNKARKKAENSISSLSNSIKLYSDAVKQAKEYIIKNHVKRQEFADTSQVTQTIHHTKERHHPTPPQEQTRKVERAKGIALAM